MTMEAKVRPWLLIVLAAVVILGGGFTYWYSYANKNKVATATSPTPTKSAAVSPTTSAAGPKTSPILPGQTPTPIVKTPSPAPSNKTYEGNIYGQGGSCGSYNISFDYPGDAFYNASSEPEVTGDSLYAIIENSFFDYTTHVEYLCPKYDDPTKLYELYQNVNDNPTVVEGPTKSTINGKQAIKWTLQYPEYDNGLQGKYHYYRPITYEKKTIILDTNGNFVLITSISYTDQGQNLPGYDLIVDSFQFK